MILKKYYLIELFLKFTLDMPSTKAAAEVKIPKLEIHVCHCAERDREESLRHWMLMLNEPEAVNGDWMHWTGGPNHKQFPAPFSQLIALLSTRS